MTPTDEGEAAARTRPVPTLGIRQNLPQFSLLVLLNAFVGGMVGLERTILPLIAEADFAIASSTAAVSFIATFGGAKALMNLFGGNLSEHWGRRRLLVAGWLVALPVPVLLIVAPTWSVVLLANVLLGVSQGLAWSMTVVMKVDIALPRERGVAVGLNEFAGYGGLAVVALATGWLASRYGLRPEPLYLGVALAVVGLVLALAVRDTTAHNRVHQAQAEHTGRSGQAGQARQAGRPSLRRAIGEATWGDRTLGVTALGGLATNLKDGMLWGLLPILLVAQGLTIGRVGIVVALYPAVWGVSQLVFGPLSDRVGRKPLIVSGLVVQAAGVLGFALVDTFALHLVAASLTGIGTGMVYPTMIALVSDVAHPSWRASALGVYRFWRDLGYLVGALGAGLVADLAGVPAAVTTVGVVVLVVAVVTWAATEEEARAEPLARGHGQPPSEASPEP